MGDVNQFHLVQNIAHKLEGPFLEIGSKNYGSTQDLRTMFKSRGEYIGLDMESGDGVDLVLDLTQDFADVDAALNGERFGTIICLSVLEHCEQPFKMAENITRLLKPKGQAVICVPFAWKFHGYPSDYWRFTHEGVKKLFPQLTFDLKRSLTSTSREREFKPIDENIGKIPLSSKPHRRQGYKLRSLVAPTLRKMAKVGIFDWLTSYRYVMAPTNIFMVGTREEAVSRAA